MRINHSRLGFVKAGEDFLLPLLDLGGLDVR